MRSISNRLGRMLIGLEVVALTMLTVYWAGVKASEAPTSPTSAASVGPGASGGLSAQMMAVLAATGSPLASASGPGPASATASLAAATTASGAVVTVPPLAPTGAPTIAPTPAPVSAPTPRPTTVSIVAAGDIACDPAHNTGQPRDCDQAATANLIGQIHPTAVLTLGDTQYEVNALSAYQAVFAPTWGAYKSIIYPTIGNHEYLTSGAAGYFAYFGFPSYYAVNLGDWHIISLNSECHFVGGCQAGSPQETWLKANLAAYPRLCTLVTFHEPSWSSGQHADASQMTQIWADLVAAKVDVVLSGHNHDYERFVPLDAAGNPDPAGTAEFVVGTGGKNDYGFTNPPLSGEVVRSDATFGVLSMTLGATSYSWRFVPAAGYSFTDSGSASCH